MSYAHVVNNAIDQSAGAVPGSGQRLDTGQWVSGLRVADTATQQACGWYLVTDIAKPADTATLTYDRSITLVGGVPTVTWTQRNKTQPEIDGDTANANRATIVTNLTADMAAVQLIINDTNANINANPAAAIKTISRMLRRLGRQAVNDFTGSS